MWITRKQFHPEYFLRPMNHSLIKPTTQALKLEQLREGFFCPQKFMEWGVPPSLYGQILWRRFWYFPKLKSMQHNNWKQIFFVHAREHCCPRSSSFWTCSRSALLWSNHDGEIVLEGGMRLKLLCLGIGKLFAENCSLESGASSGNIWRHQTTENDLLEYWNSSFFFIEITHCQTGTKDVFFFSHFIYTIISTHKERYICKK